MADFKLRIDLDPLKELDEFALLACQRYNLGNETDWFGSFRGGLYGFYARIHGVLIHYEDVHSWMPKPRTPTELEFQVTSVLFNMDSAIECLAFALNALGFAIFPSGFHDVTDRRALTKVSPRNLIGPNSVIHGYAQIFPRVQAYWISHQDLLTSIFDLHDVSKHRQTIVTGGRIRNDPPAGFFSALGIQDNKRLQVIVSPSAEISLLRDPKAPKVEPPPQTVSERVLLETLANEFHEFVNESAKLALADSRANILLNHDEFQDNG